MSEFNTSKYWEKRYTKGGNSGAGAYNHLAEFKAEVINRFVEKNCIQNILEFGCGDGNNLALYNIKNYTGIDIASKAIEICKAKFAQDISKKFFTLDAFMYAQESFKLSELVVSLDVIYHLIENEIFDAYMNNLFDSSSKYIIIYASNFNEVLCSHVKHRKFTDWIETHKPNWKQIEFIKNKYPWNPEKPNETSFSDFYIFERMV